MQSPNNYTSQQLHCCESFIALSHRLRMFSCMECDLLSLCQILFLQSYWTNKNKRRKDYYLNFDQRVWFHISHKLVNTFWRCFIKYWYLIHDTNVNSRQTYLSFLSQPKSHCLIKVCHMSAFLSREIACLLFSAIKSQK